MNEVGTKYCTKCDGNLPATLEYFHRNNQQSDGLHIYCKLCRAAMHREYLKTDKGRRANLRAVYKYFKTDKGVQVKTKCDKKRWKNKKSKIYNTTGLNRNLSLVEAIKDIDNKRIIYNYLRKEGERNDN